MINKYRFTFKGKKLIKCTKLDQQLELPFEEDLPGG